MHLFKATWWAKSHKSKQSLANANAVLLSQISSVLSIGLFNSWSPSSQSEQSMKVEGEFCSRVDHCSTQKSFPEIVKSDSSFCAKWDKIKIFFFSCTVAESKLVHLICWEWRHSRHAIGFLSLAQEVAWVWSIMTNVSAQNYRCRLQYFVCEWIMNPGISCWLDPSNLKSL